MHVARPYLVLIVQINTDYTINSNAELYITLLEKLVDKLIPSSLKSKDATDSNLGEGEPHTEGEVSATKKEQVVAIVNTWLFFANSIMSGEFLAYPDYSRTLDTIINTIRQAYDNKFNASADGDILNAPPYLHPVLAVIHDLCFELRTRCLLMRIQIKVEKEKESVLAISSPLPHQWCSSSSEDEEVMRLVSWVQQMAGGLIEMTEIDFTCHTSKEKISSLHFLFDACEQTKRITALDKGKEYTPFTVEPDISDLSTKAIPYGVHFLDAIRCKCSLLAYQSIFKIRQKKGEPLFSSAERTTLVWDESQYKDREAPYKAVEKALLIINRDRHSALAPNSPNESLLSFWKKHLYHHKGELISFQEGKHIIQYNEYIKESKKIKAIFSEVITQIRDLENPRNEISTLDTIISQIQERECGDPPFEFLLACMRAIESIKINPDNYEDSHTRVKLLGDLLLRLYTFKRKYECINQPYEQTRFFEQSFFTCDPDHPIPFFIASLGCKYINPDWLEELDLRYNRLLRQYRIQESEVLFSTSNKISNKIIKDSKQLESTIKQNESTLKEQQRDYLTLLGVFAAVITLSVSLVTSFKLAESIWDYMAMLGGAYVLIGLLVIVLYLRNTTKQKEGQLTIATMNKSMVIAACLGILGVGVKGYKEIFPQDTKHESQPTAVSPTTVNQVHIGIPKNEASIDPSQGKTPKRQTDTIAQ